MTTTRSDLNWIDGANFDTSSLLSTQVVRPRREGKDDWVAGQDNVTLINNKSAIPQSGELSKAQCLDVDESTLLCEMAARGDTDPIEKPLDWYKSYVNKLVTLGWKTDNMDGNSYREDKDEFALSDIAVKILSGLLGGPAGAAIQAAITQLRQYDKEGIGGVDLFSSVNKSIGKHSFAASYVRLNPQLKKPEIAVSFFSVKMARQRSDILVARLDRQTTDLFAHSTTLHLTDSYDDATRKMVREAIAEHRKEGIKKWKLKK
jgi:hypothetical protein